MWEDVEGTAGRHGLVHLRASFEGERVLHLRPTVSNHMTSGKRPLLRVWFLICVVNQRRCRISPRAGVWGERELPGFLGGQVVGGWHQRSPRAPAGPYSSRAAEWGRGGLQAPVLCPLEVPQPVCSVLLLQVFIWVRSLHFSLLFGNPWSSEGSPEL